MMYFLLRRKFLQVQVEDGHHRLQEIESRRR